MEAVLSIAGSDSSGGAGIQADIKTIMAHGLFAETAVTALTAQNTTGVYGVMDVDPEFVERQIDVVFDDIRPAAVKVGMVSSPEIVRAIARALSRNDARNIVVDPVMVATSGSALIADAAVQALVSELFPLAAVVTPNLPEAEVLCGFPVRSEKDAQRAACAIAEAGAGGAVLVKGGHLAGEDSSDDGAGRPAADCREQDAGQANDLLRLASGRFVWLRGKRIDTRNTHGTGCTLSSAIACGLACSLPVEEALRRAKAYVAGALAADLELGKGAGPLDHAYAFR